MVAVLSSASRGAYETLPTSPQIEDYSEIAESATTFRDLWDKSNDNERKEYLRVLRRQQPNKSANQSTTTAATAKNAISTEPRDTTDAVDIHLRLLGGTTPAFFLILILLLWAQNGPDSLCEFFPFLVRCYNALPALIMMGIVGIAIQLLSNPKYTPDGYVRRKRLIIATMSIALLVAPWAYLLAAQPVVCPQWVIQPDANSTVASFQ